jgi:hypothetical protein
MKVSKPPRAARPIALWLMRAARESCSRSPPGACGMAKGRRAAHEMRLARARGRLKP